ncbi:MAG: ATP-dependent acyl-CoA ligase [Promethearchaeota archaeon]|nr:MAG: ATP-dependent acyl-CoA ligase [Candidatus Lokiarchaeota archaeon]
MEQFKISEKNVLGCILEENAKLMGDKTFLIYEDNEISYKQLNLTVNKIANGFLNLGIKNGDKVAIMMENCLEFIYTWFALSKIGAIEVPINFFHKGEVLKYLINYSDAEILVLSGAYIRQIKKIENDLTNIKLALIDPLSPEPRLKKFAIEPYNSLLNNPATPPEINVKYNDLMAILFTSGTTGISKGVMLTHNQMIFQGYMYVYTCGITNEDRMYHYLPLFHEAGQCGGTLAPLIAKGTIILKKSFSATKFWDEIREYKITKTGGFEPIVRILHKAPPQENDGDHLLRVFVCGHVPPDIHEDFQNRFNVKLIDAYGMTETDMSISATLNDIKIGSCGKAHTQYFEVKLFDEYDMEVPIGTPGEIAIRPLLPYIVMEGYYKMPEYTLRAFKNLWFHTGDLVYKDENGFYYFVDRKKDMVRRAGENVSSKEVEEIINSHESIKECAVVGVKDEIVGEEIKVAIVLKRGKSVLPQELIEYCDKRMAYFMVPRYIEFLEELPKQLDGQKIIKEKLKDINSNTWDRKKAGIKLKREKEKNN